VYVHGGFDGVEHLNDTWRLDLRTMGWDCLQEHDAEGTSPVPVSQHQLVNSDGKLVRIGGETSGEHRKP